MDGFAPTADTLPAIRSVLLVDDSAAQRAYAVALCQELGIREVREASNGLEALALLGALEAPPDLLIIDLEMPTMDGPELLTRLR
ncbi:MAG TPA: response regulator, partial [Steroidobacteraceae bacterium]|nr:response regulator [Steroidobacteraceae bacterium]